MIVAAGIGVATAGVGVRSPFVTPCVLSAQQHPKQFVSCLSPVPGWQSATPSARSSRSGEPPSGPTNSRSYATSSSTSTSWP